jgi:hypothetical protein
MPRLEHIQRNAELARNFAPLSARQRQRLAESIEAGTKQAMVRFLQDHQDVWT